MWIVIVLLFLTACATASQERKEEPGQVLITHGVGYSSKIGTAEGQAAPDSDFAADPQPTRSTNDGPAGFAATTQAVLDAAAQGQGGVHKGSATVQQPDGSFRYATFQVALQCESLLADASEAVPRCSAEQAYSNCLRGSKFEPSECPGCAEVVRIDEQLSNNGCPPRPQYPVLREGK